jgi:TonB family protein
MLAIVAVSSVSFAGNSALNTDEVKNEKYEGKLLNRVEPEYPWQAAQDNMSGAVLLKFDIRPNGQTTNITVVKSKPSGVFDNVAMTALSHWRYETHSQDVISDSLVQLDFVMDENSERVSLD